MEQKQQKKPSKVQMQRRLERAILHIDRTRNTNEIYFFDKGVRLIVTEDVAIIETSFHRHVFGNITSSGVSRPYLYVKRFVEMANDNKDAIKQGDKGYSYQALFDVLKAKDDKTEYNIAWYTDLWLFNIFQPLYSIGETEAESFLVYEAYLHNIARNATLLNEKAEGMTNKKFVEEVIDNIKAYVAELDERIIFPKKTDEDLMRENIEAMREQELNEAMEDAKNDGSKD